MITDEDKERILKGRLKFDNVDDLIKYRERTDIYVNINDYYKLQVDVIDPITTSTIKQ